MILEQYLTKLDEAMLLIPSPVEVGAGFDPNDPTKVMHLSLCDSETDGGRMWLGIKPPRLKSLEQLEAIARVINLVHEILEAHPKPTEPTP